MNIKIIEKENNIIAYVPETMRIFEINSQTKNIICDIEHEMKEVDIIEKYNISIETYKNLKEKLSKICDTCVTFQRNQSRQGLSKLVLNISNMCNLQCQYCYANGGSYQSNEGMMSKETAKKALDIFYEKYGEINMIQLFGGEPLLNLEVFQYVCEYIYSNNKKTQIGVVTNGTLMSNNFIELVKRYNIMVTISYDGVPNVNDIMRITKDGSGTSEIILSNIKQLYAETKQPSTIEVTYTQRHVEHGISIGNIIKFIRKEIGDIPLHIVPAGGNIKTCDFVLKNRDEFLKSVDDIFENSNNVNLYTFSLVQRIIHALYTRKGGRHLCEAGLSTYSVSIDGSVYPCFMFTDDSSLCIGNVYDNQMFEKDKFISIVNKLSKFNKENITECKECFIQRSCNGCLGINLLETGNVFSLGKETCEMYRKMTEQVIYNLYLKKRSC